MDVPSDGKCIIDWDEEEVLAWLSSLGYPQYGSQIKEHNISGDVLCMLDLDGLKAVGISTVGQRLHILKSVYLLKLAQSIPIDPDHYIPPSEAQERHEPVSLDRLHEIVTEQNKRLQSLEDENNRLNEVLQSFFEEFNHLRSSLTQAQSDDPSPLRRQPSFKWANYVKPGKSPTKPDIESPHPSPQQLEHDISYNRTPAPPPFTSTTNSSDKQFAQRVASDVSTATSPNANKPKGQDSNSDNLKSFKVSLDDPTWKVLPAALKKYRINNDSWQNYAMFICYGSASNRIERCLSYDEKPLLLFQRLKDARKNPVFMLKHIKDIRSPIVVAQQKHAARKASSTISAGDVATNTSRVSGVNQNRTTRPPKLEVNDIAAPPMTGVSGQPGWPEVMSPSSDQKDRVDEATTPATVRTHDSTSTAMSGATAVGSTESTRTRTTMTENADTSSSTTVVRENPVASSGVSYAVAIYPYMAEQDDEFDVVVGDTFVILSRARGWWVVQRDPTGSGIVDTDTSKQGWVPAGCLLETNVPVASAIAEATSKKSESGSPPHSPVSKTPILPLSIISTSFPGIALMDYKKKGDEELNLVKDDALRVFKRYNHWSYAVKEDGGDRGWVPSWFIGKVSQMPATPTNATAPVHNSSMSLDDASNLAQVSPMSSAFPPSQARTTPV